MDTLEVLNDPTLLSMLVSIGYLNSTDQRNFVVCRYGKDTKFSREELRKILEDEIAHIKSIFTVLSSISLTNLRETIFDMCSTIFDASKDTELRIYTIGEAIGRLAATLDISRDKMSAADNENILSLIEILTDYLNVYFAMQTGGSVNELADKKAIFNMIHDIEVEGYRKSLTAHFYKASAFTLTTAKRHDELYIAIGISEALGNTELLNALERYGKNYLE